MSEHLYYLHTNGDLIYKRDIDGSQAADIRESPFARGLWFIDLEDREDAWTLLVEALAAGANKERVQELAEKWGCDDEDAETYAKRLGFEVWLGGDWYCANRADFDVEKSLTDPEHHPLGTGDTALFAIADLAKKLGYRPSKTGWAPRFAALVHVDPIELDIPD